MPGAGGIPVGAGDRGLELKGGDDRPGPNGRGGILGPAGGAAASGDGEFVARGILPGGELVGGLWSDSSW